jgi:type II secretory pathway pseudopilin PulG
MRRPRVAWARGYTLMELVVAAMISLLVISGLYVVYATQARVFRGQEMVSQAQIASRFALQTVRADLQRVGYMTTTDSFDSRVVQKLCETPPVRILGVTLVQEATPDGAVWARHAAIKRPDSVTLVGNFTNEEVYWVERISSTGVVTLQNNFAIDSTDPFPQDPNVFDQVFVANQTLVRIRHQDKVFYSRVNSADHGGRTVNLADGPSCLNSIWDGAELNVVNMVRYSVVPATLNAAEAAISGSVKGIANRFDLVREFLSWEDGTTVTTRQVVAENVVDFQVWFMFEDLINNQAGPSVDYSGAHALAYPLNDANQGLTGIGICSSGVIGSNSSCSPMNIRGAIVRVSTRTPHEDPSFRLPAAPWNPLAYYDVDENSDGAARVRSLTSYVDMPNIRFGQ